MLPERWPELQPWLDAALEADGAAAQAAVLQSLQSQDADLAAQLQALLRSHALAGQEGYLEHGPDRGLFGSPLTGQNLGPWTLQTLIGEGGMGSVWRATRNDGRYAGLAAVKLLNLTLASPARTERFRREGDILARLTHPAIARLLDAGVTPAGQPYLVLEHVDGLAIDRHADAQGLDVAARIRLFVALLDAVTHAHQHLVVHRDIKPSNVMVTADGQVKLLDFGIAKTLVPEAGDTDRTNLTQRAGAMLSPGYAAPEQLTGGAITVATDVYALGVLLYGLLSGRHPAMQAGDTAAVALRNTLERDATLASVAVLAGGGTGAGTRAGTRAGIRAGIRGGSRGGSPTDRPADTHQDTSADALAARRGLASAAALRRRLQGDLDNILARALHREPAQRYASAAAFADDLQRHLARQPVQARAPSLAYRTQRFVQRQRVPVAVAVVGLAALAVVGAQAWNTRQAARLSQARAATVDGLLQSLFSGMSPDLAANRSFSARELLDRGQAFLDRSPSIDTATRHAARGRMAGLYRDIGAFEPAAAAYAAEAQEAERGGDPRKHVLALWNLADVQLKQRDFKVSAATLQSLATLSAPHLAQDPDLAGRLAVLQGELLLGTGQYAQAASRYASADTSLAQARPADLELQARSAQGHGWSARLAGQMATAGLQLRRAADIAQQRGEPGSVDRLNIEVQIAALDNWLGRHAEAGRGLAAAQQELAARLGPQHPMVVLAVSERAIAELRQGHFDATHAQLLQLRGGSGPADAWRGPYADALAARISMYQGRSEQAEPALRALLQAKFMEEGRASGKTEPLRRLHAEALLRLGRNAEAEAALRVNAAHLTALNQTVQHNSVAASHVLLGCALARQGDVAGATALWAQAAPLLAEQLGPQHPFALAAAAYAALANPASPAATRQALADRLQQQLGWQDGAPRLAEWLRERGAAVDWRRLPVVL